MKCKICGKNLDKQSYKVREMMIGLKKMAIYYQIAGQVYYMNKAIEDSLKKISEKNKVIFKYEDFCQNPVKYYQEIREKYKFNGFKMPEQYDSVASFNVTNDIKISKEEINKFKKAYCYFENK